MAVGHRPDAAVYNDTDVIAHRSDHEWVQHEFPADGAAVTAGYLVERTAGGVQHHSVAAEENPDVLVALNARERGMERGDDYGAGNLVKFVNASGGILHLALAAGETLAQGDEVVSAGDGTVRALDTVGGDTRAAVIGVADLALDNSAGTAPAWVAVELDN